MKQSDIDEVDTIETSYSWSVNGIEIGTAAELVLSTTTVAKDETLVCTTIANDGTDDSNISTVTITVASVNDAPVATDVNIQIDEKIINLLNKLSQSICNLYGFSFAESSGINVPSINLGPCGPFANEFYKDKRKRHTDTY